MSATRLGVSLRPSRFGSCPISIRISLVNCFMWFISICLTIQLSHFNQAEPFDLPVGKRYERSELSLPLNLGLGKLVRISHIMDRSSTIDPATILPGSFYARDTVEVARDLLGEYLVGVKGRTQMVGRIVEVEAYRGSDDPASHAYRGITPTNPPIFANPPHT